MYKEILQSNSECALTGSHSLILQGFKVKREPKDIDIYDPTDKFKTIPGMSLPKSTIEKDVNYEEPEGSDWQMTQYLLDKIKVDVFYSPSEKPKIIKIGGVRCVHWIDIVKAKLSFIHPDSKSKCKHWKDLLFMLMCNDERLFTKK